jgi:hypothetical protein
MVQGQPSHGGVCETPISTNSWLLWDMYQSFQAMQEAEIGRIPILGQPTQKSLQDSISMEKSRALWHMPGIPVTAGSLKWDDHSPG